MPQEHAGHRQRMYSKMEKQELLDWERMEVLLYPYLPRRNTVDLAHKLLLRFGSVAGVFLASLEELQMVEGIGSAIAHNLHAQGKVYKELCKTTYDPFANRFHLKEFCLRGVDMYRGEQSEVLDIYLLGESGELISRHRRSDEQEGRVYLDTKWLGKLLSDEEVYGVVIVHNHPEGRAHHSSNDEMATRACQMVCNMHGKILCDHVIFSQDEVYSYYEKGKLQDISKEYSVNTLIKEKVKKERTKQAKSLLEEAMQERKKQKGE